MSFQPLLNTLRFTFLCGSIIALVTALNWERIKVHIDPYDEALIERHMRGPTEALVAAQESLKAGETERGLEQLAVLAKDLRGVRLGTRLEHFRTAALDLLTAEHLKAGHDEEALAWTEELLEYNPRDFPAMLRRAELHRRMGNDAAELADVEAAYRVGAATGAAITPYIGAMARRGRGEEVAEALLELGATGPLVIPTRGWEFRWAPGADFAFEPSAALELDVTDEAGRHMASPTLPTGSITATSLRVDLPTSSHMAVRDLDIALETADGRTEHFTLEHLVVANHLVQRDDGSLVANGQLDPYVILQRGDAATAAPVQDVRRATVRLSLAPALPDAASALFPNGLTDTQRSAWTARYGVDLVTALEVGLGR